MTEQYNEAIATHYSSYRPPLHKMILRQVLSDKETFRNGLDVGCGTGYSAVALANYCHHVYGIEPSQSMLDEAIPHEKITYLKGAGEQIPLKDYSVDVVTFAGSLFYAKSAALIKELKRVCRMRALVISYDFEILLDDILRQYGLGPQEADSDYDHNVNFSDVAGFMEIVAGSERVSLEVTAPEFAHILLSDIHRYASFVEKYDTSDPYPALTNELQATRKHHLLKADIYFARYQLNRVEENHKNAEES